MASNGAVIPTTNSPPSKFFDRPPTFSLRTHLKQWYGEFIYSQ